MTEADWLSCAEPGPMLEFVRHWASDRKSRLFAVGCCRRVWHMLTHEASRVHVEVAEQFADRVVGYEALKEQQRLVEDALWAAGWETDTGRPAWLVKAEQEAAMAAVQDQVYPAGVATAVAESVGWEVAAPRLAGKDYAAWRAAVQAAQRKEREWQRDSVRCVFGNPFRHDIVKPSWLTTAVVGLARAIYDDRAYDRLPELADALREADCKTDEILAHCLERRPHLRGCWAVDSILGKV